MSDATSIVFVVDDDISVRESLELLIGCEGWRPGDSASQRFQRALHEFWRVMANRNLPQEQRGGGKFVNAGKRVYKSPTDTRAFIARC